MSGTRDVIFVMIDSARKDRVSAYDHHRPTTPVLDDIAGEATRYDNAFVPAPWTLPSHCSMFTGRFPSEHGITNGFTDRNLRLSTDEPTMAEVLSDRGYATAGFSNNPWVGQLSGLDRGFDRFVEWDLELSRSEQPADRVRDRAYSKFHRVLGRAAGQPQAILKRRFFTSNLVDRASGWLAETEHQPTFTFLNLMEAHSPYYPPDSAFKKLGLDTPGLFEARTLNTKLLAYVMGKTALDTATRERIMEFYDASLRFQDGKLAELRSTLRSRGLYEDTLVVICADHGKTLGEYDRNETPPHYVRDINVNVPLVIKEPGQTEGRTVDMPVELTDLFEVVTDPAETAGLPTKRNGALVEDYVPHTAKQSTDVTCWRVLADQTAKYVESDDGRQFLFDRDGDRLHAGATDADFGPYREQLQKRVDELDVADGSNETAADEPLRSEVEGQLQDLGYLG